MGDSVVEGTLVSWLKGVGDSVVEDEVLCSIETDKVTVDLRAPIAGTVVELKAETGSTVAVDKPIVVLRPGKGAAPKAAPKAEAPKAPQAEAPKAPQAEAPKAEAPKAEAPKAVKAEPPREAAKAKAPEAKAEVLVTGTRVERRIPMNRMRQRIAQRLKESQNTAAMLTTFNEIDMTNIMALRNKHKDEFLEKHGAKLGFMSAFVKASSYALMRSPAVNGFFDADNKQIVYRDYVDVSVAVSTPTGLVVPVLRNTESMSFHDVEATIAMFGKKARNGQIAMEDMAGGTFTISNGGVYGSLFGTPILNPPQSAVLGMHGIFKRPVAVGDKIEIRPMMYVALTYDHRIIDGKDAVTFLVDVKNAIEDPQRMLLNL